MKMIVLTCWQFENWCVWHKPHRTNNVCSWSPMDLWPKHKKYKHGRYERRVPKPSVFNTCLKDPLLTPELSFLEVCFTVAGPHKMNSSVIKAGPVSPPTRMFIYSIPRILNQSCIKERCIFQQQLTMKIRQELCLTQEIPALKTETLRWSNHTGALPWDPSSKTFSCSISLGPNKHLVLKNLKGHRLNLRSLW